MYPQDPQSSYHIDAPVCYRQIYESMNLFLYLRRKFLPSSRCSVSNCSALCVFRLYLLLLCLTGFLHCCCFLWLFLVVVGSQQTGEFSEITDVYKKIDEIRGLCSSFYLALYVVSKVCSC